MKRTPHEFRRAAQEHGITRWPMHDCSICGYPCAFVFEGGQVFYDGGCNCVTYNSPLRPQSWQDVANHYNIQTSDAVIARYDEFWNFDRQPA